MPAVDDSIEFPLPLAWEDKAAAMIWIPGSPEQILDRLAFFLSEIASDTLNMDEITWPDTNERLATRNLTGTYGRCGLVMRNPSKRCGLELTAEAMAWLSSRNADYLVAILHANVKFVGELLECVDERTTHEQLRKIADKRFVLGWKTLDQIRRRTNWLRAAGYLELWTNLDLALTDQGRTARKMLQLTSPDDLRINQSDRPANVSNPPPAIAAALAGMSQEKLLDRKRAISYIPGGDEFAQTVAGLVSAVDPSATRSEFCDFCETTFSISESSADSALQSLRSAGLIEQTGPNSFSPTTLAVEWIASGDPLDLVRILHCHFIGFGEALFAATQVDGSGKIARYLSDYFGIAQIPVGEAATRMRLLHSAGLVDRITQFNYRINPLGRSLLETLPLLQNDLGETPTQEETRSDEWSGDETTDLAMKRDEAESIAAELVESAFDNARHRRLEAAVAAAFRYLGLGAKHLGYSDRTDVLLTSWLSPGLSKTVIVDTKAASAGMVEEGRVNFDKLELHRSHYSADKIVLVGTEFVERVRNYAKNRSVTLIRTEDLADWVRRHSQVPISASVIVALLEGEDYRVLRRDWETSSQRRELFGGVVQQLWESANNDADIRMSGGALSARDLWISLRGEYPDAQLSDIDATLQILSSDLVRAIKRVKDGGYVMIDPPILVIQKIRSLLGAVEPAAPFSSEQNTAESLPEAGEDESVTANGREGGIGIKRNLDEIDPATVREWAKRQGIPVRDRGRLPGSLVRRYREANELV